MSNVVLDTSVIIPYLGNVAYDRLVCTRLVRDQVYISTVSGMELLTGSLAPDQRKKADEFLSRLGRRQRMVTPTHEEWLRAGLMLARFQNTFGQARPWAHVGDILILLTAERLSADLVTENGTHFRLWAKFRPPTKRPRLVVVERHGNEV